MDFPKDAGLSCVRYYLVPRDPALESLALEALSAPGRHVGSLVCQCAEVNQWSVYLSTNETTALLACQCNGSSLPIYIGSPTEQHPDAKILVASHACQDAGLRVVIAIGYPGEVPALGTIEVEVAQELVLAAHCPKCDERFIRWHLTLAAPPAFQGDEPWLRYIQGYKERSFWDRLPPKDQAKHPEAPPSRLFDLAEQFPTEVLQNPALPLVALESPALWEEIQYQALTNQLEQELEETSKMVSPQGLLHWRYQCAMRSLERHAPRLTPEERRAKEEHWRGSKKDESFVKRSSWGSHHSKAKDAVRFAKDARRFTEERAALYAEAATEMTLHLLTEASRRQEFGRSAAEAASYLALSEGRSPEDAYIEEYRWQLTLLQQLK